MGTNNHEINEILAIPGNNFCADCGCHSPRWASINLGVLICINCSGVHRKLGVHISKVKSLTLDTLKAEWIHNLKYIGNVIANSYYLSRLPSDAPKLRPGESAHKIEIWIRNKYEKKIYAAVDFAEPYILVNQGKDPRKVYSSVKSKFHKPCTDFVADFSNITMSHSPPTSKGAPLIDFGNNDVNFADFESHSNMNVLNVVKSTDTENQSTHISKEETMPNLADVYKIRDAKIEAAKACIAKMYKNPEQLGLQSDSNDIKPSCLDDSGNIDFTKLFKHDH